MRRVVVCVLVIGISISVFGGEPFRTLFGPVYRIEQRNYDVVLKYGEPVAEYDGRHVSLYDIQGNEIETTYYGNNELLEKRFERLFDSQNRLVQTDEYNRLDNLVERTLVSYSGNIQRYRGYDLQGEITSASDWELDENGNEVRVVTYDEETGEVSSILHQTFRSDGEQLSMVMYGENSEPMAVLEYEYDVGGMDYIDRSELYVLGAVFMRFENGYVFSKVDSQGNWTEKRSYEMEEEFGESQWVPMYIYVRTIEYY